MSEVPTEPSYELLKDEWDRFGPIPLDGWLERQGFSPVLMAFVGLVVAFVLFQVIISPIATVALLAMRGVSPHELFERFETLITEHAASLLMANTVGQILGLAVPAYLLAAMHTRRPRAFLRVREVDGAFIILSVGALIALTPVIQWLGAVNEQLPLPDFIRQFEQSQLELIERVLNVDTGLFFNLAVLAVTPAICEELLFRGYVQREAERGMGAAAGVAFSGLIFAAYHLRFSQILPLSVLGVFLAYLVWRTGSLWPAVAVHFANNAIAVAIGAYISQRPELDIADIEQMDVPWYLLFVGAALFAAALWGIERHAEARRANLSARDEWDAAESGTPAREATQ